MPLTPGVRLGPYEVLALLGSGGMGEVYRARDTRLDRTVAIKVLHAHVAEDPTLRQRFEREARAVSSLNHPRICTLYDIGRQDDREFLVMEYLKGETLAERLRRGRLPLEDALRCAVEIAEGLDYAHRQGVVHRDVKPANVMLTRSGAKLLDFGIAKLRDPVAEATGSLDRALARKADADLSPDISLSQAFTREGSLTQDGTILGSFEYMAPEQLQSAEADARTDVFAFGAVLYEMVTGRRAFDASTRARLIGAILLTDPPPIQDVESRAPAIVQLVVARCLAKDPEERWQSVRDLLSQLRWILSGVPMQGLPPKERGRRVSAVVATVVLLALAAGFVVWNVLPPPPVSAGSSTRWDVATPEGQSLSADLFPSLAVSPDGAHLVFRAESRAAAQLYLRRIDEFEARPLAGTQGAHTPFFSPDGQWIAFLANSKVHRVSVAGGLPVVICEAPSLSPGSPGATWGPDGTIVFAAGVAGLMRVSSAGGTPQPLTVPDPKRGEVTHIAPQFLTGGEDLLFTIRTADEGWRLAILSLKTLEWKSLPPIIGEIAGAQYVKTGHVVYAQSGGLQAIPFDLSQQAFNGSAQRLAEDVYTRAVADAIVAQFSVSETGVLAYVSGHPPDWTLVSVRAGGQASRLTDSAHLYRYPRFSPDGRRVAVAIEEERSDIYLVDADRGSLRKLTKTGSNTQPVWTPDGRHVTFASRRRGSEDYDLFRIPIDESADAEPLVTRKGRQFPSGWSPMSGDTLAFYELSNETARDIWIWSSRTTTATSWLATNANERGATFSSDGRWLAYVSDDSGRDEVYIQRYPGPGGREVVSSGGGTEPVWSPNGREPNGRELFYRKDGKLFTVTMRTEPTVRADTPRLLFDGPFVSTPAEVGRPNYDVSPDGQSFIMVSTTDRSRGAHLHVVHNWFQELQRLVPPN